MLFLIIGYKLGKGEKVKVKSPFKIKMPMSGAETEILEWVSPEEKEKKKQENFLKKILGKK